ncbi:melanoma-associated antigen B10 [Nannospalax galili]|uniref:melanoma-associated antigen B10 n=1 Tax=Nannospalax galili TaxID=1026970 RepID=UPI0004ED5954|nr:melanoma-associated antigen B10 [Nannospalax galili]
MPRGQKSKLRAREKRRQAQEKPKNVNEAETTAAKESPCSLSPKSKVIPQGSSAAALHNHQEPERAQSTKAADSTHVSSTGSNNGAKSQVEGNTVASELSIEHSAKDPLEGKIALLVHYLLYKYQEKEPITKAEIMKNIIQTYKNHFPEILRKASDHIELVFGLEVKEVDPKRSAYVLINKLDLECGTTVNDKRGMPVTGLLMTVLGVIFTKNNCASEEQVWEVLNIMGVYEGRKHFIFGDVKKVLIDDFVRQKYLEYQQVPNSDPPCYQFLWGPRAYAETSKMKVLKFFAKIHGTVPTTFMPWYEEALKDEKERAQAKAAARACSVATAGLQSKAMFSPSSCPK